MIDSLDIHIQLRRVEIFNIKRVRVISSISSISLKKQMIKIMRKQMPLDHSLVFCTDHFRPAHSMRKIRGSSSHCQPRSYCLCLWMITNKQSYSVWQVLTSADLSDNFVKFAVEGSINLKSFKLSIMDAGGIPDGHVTTNNSFVFSF